VALGRGRHVFSSSKGSTRSAFRTLQGSLVSSLTSGVHGVAEALFTTLFPSDCRLCSVPLVNISRLPVCEHCLSSIRPLAGGLCSICGERLAVSMEDGRPRPSSTDPDGLISKGEARCALCNRAEPPYVKAAVYGSYEGGLRELIHLLKYDGVRPAANVLGRMLSDATVPLRPLFAEGPVMVVPVPLHVRKRRQRGFNQAELIARAAVKLDPSRRLELKPVLERLRETQSQIGLSRHQRRENLRGAFAVTEPEAIRGREALLVDDVFTTGTTASECARVLHRAGAAKVYVATVARTLKLEAQGARLEPATMTMAAAS
jgi:ComF family protein